MPESHYKTSTVGILGEILFLQIFICYAIVSLGFITHIPVGYMAFPTAFVLGFAISSYHRVSLKKTGTLAILSVSCWIAAILFSIPLIDASYDGNAYHQEIIAAICRGWYPGGAEIEGVPLSIWTLHYAKGIEMAEAVIVSFTGFLESGKAINLILGISVGFYTYGFLSNSFPNVKNLYRWLVALVVISNPVFISQALTYYIDYAKYFYTLFTILILLQIAQRPKSTHLYVILFAVINMSIATKFNSFFEEGVTIFAGLLWLFWHRRYSSAKKLITISAIAAIIGVFLFGYHPYITNYIIAGHPLFPLLGEGSVDIMTGNTPPEYLFSDRFTNFFRSLATFAYPTVDQRQGGFGILMLPMLVISLYSIWVSRRRWKGVGLYIAIWLLASCFFFEQSWWARYISQLWIIVVEGLFFMMVGETHKKMNTVLIWSIISCVVLTGIVTMEKSLATTIRQTCYRYNVVSELRNRRVKVMTLNEAYLRQMQEKNIIAVPCFQTESTSYLLPYYGLVSEPESFPILVLDSVTKANILNRLDKLPFDYSANLNSNP